MTLLKLRQGKIYKKANQQIKGSDKKTNVKKSRVFKINFGIK